MSRTVQNGARLDGVSLTCAVMDDTDFEVTRDAAPRIAVRPPASQDDVTVAIDQHTLWIEHLGKAGARADLSGQDLSGLDLQGALLGAAIMRGAVLRGRPLRGALLAMADLAQVDARDSDLFCADLQGAMLDRVTLMGACLAHVNASPLLMPGGRFQPASFVWARLRRTDLCAADLSQAWPDQVDLTEADWTSTRLTGAKFDATTEFPVGFDPARHDLAAHGPVQQGPVQPPSMVRQIARVPGCQAASRSRASSVPR
jgi:uncharacterized protein YjbI with pentapeptide repeats